MAMEKMMRPDDKGSCCMNPKLLTSEQGDHCQQVPCRREDDDDGDGDGGEDGDGDGDGVEDVDVS